MNRLKFTFSFSDGGAPVEAYLAPAVVVEPQLEFSPEEWAARAVGDEPIELHHGEIHQDARDVFVCRGPHGCGRYCCACCGGDGDEHEVNLCDECWCKYQRPKGAA